MTTTRALVRAIPDSFASALSSEKPASPISVALAREQHAAYVRALEACGVAVTVLAADEACPDCVFVEDTAVVIEATALVTRPGAPSRRAETRAIARELDATLDVIPMLEPATLDGGDVMRVGQAIFVGRSARTNDAGIEQLAAVFRDHRFTVVPLALPPQVLHLKCVVTPLGGDRILLADDSIAAAAFGGVHVVRVPREETYAANCVAIGDQVIVAEGFPRTHEVLRAAGFTLHVVPCSEVCKADGSLTCQSIIL